MRLDVVTIFPDYLAPLQLSLPGRAIARGIVDLQVHDLRQWTDDVHRTVDDSPYGGGPGMVMLPEPWGRALDAVAPPEGDVQPTLVIPTPAGRRLDQALAADLAARPWLVFACGRYEGIDVVVCGGEVAVLATVEAVVRLLPGVLGNADSAVHDSFSAGADGILETPPFTKPPVWRGLEVPEVLLSGHHGKIAAWRAERGRALTRERRPDLLAGPDGDGPGSIPTS